MIEISFGSSQLETAVNKVEKLLEEMMEGSPEMAQALYELLKIAPPEISRVFFDSLKKELVLYTTSGEAVCDVRSIAGFLGISEEEALEKFEGKLMALNEDELHGVN